MVGAVRCGAVRCGAVRCGSVKLLITGARRMLVRIAYALEILVIPVARMRRLCVVAEPQFRCVLEKLRKTQIAA
jgi:hypothetical protein